MKLKNLLVFIATFILSFEVSAQMDMYAALDLVKIVLEGENYEYFLFADCDAMVNPLPTPEPSHSGGGCLSGGNGGNASDPGDSNIPADDADSEPQLSPDWKFFVDPEPFSGWAHTAYIVIVHDGDNWNPDCLEITEVNMPPENELIPMDSHDYFDTESHLMEYCHSGTNAATDIHNACDTYALILSGGYNRNANHERYWNDCSFIYQTLSKKYSVPKQNIIPLIADGNDPFEDMRLYLGGYNSSPLDLDFDGEDELELSATKDNVRNALAEIFQRIKWGDQLFIFVIDHGGTSDYEKQSCINMWGYEELQDYELAEWLQPFTDKGVIVNAVLGQCFSGGFIDDLEKAGCVVATACEGSEPSYACYDKPYDEFVYEWTCAINGADIFGNPVNADTDKDHWVAMKEAFEYAKANDRAFESPQYFSEPEHLGAELTFLSTPKPIELYIKDDSADIGKVPSPNENFWNSNNIWIRNEEDGIEEHENPYYSPSHVSAPIYNKIHNRGWWDYGKSIKKAWLINYWAMGAMGLSGKAWIGMESYKDIPTGGPAGISFIEPIKAGKSINVINHWSYPQIKDLDNLDIPEEDKHYFCLLSKIIFKVYDDEYAQYIHHVIDVRGNRRIAQRNLTIVRKESQFLNNGFRVYMRNIEDVACNYNIEIKCNSNRDASLFDFANVELKLSEAVYNAWERGGFQSDCISLDSSDEQPTVVLESNQSVIKDISLNEAEFDAVTLRVNFHDAPATSESYTINLIQRDNSGRIIGGEAFLIEAPNNADNTASEVSLSDLHSFSVEHINDGSQWRYKIFDEHNKFYGCYDNPEDLTSVYQTLNSCNYKVVAISDKGDLRRIEMDNETLTPISHLGFSNGFIEISLNNIPSGDSDYIKIIPIVDTNKPVKTYNLSSGVESIRIPVHDMLKGTYFIGLYSDDKCIDMKKVVF